MEKLLKKECKMMLKLSKLSCIALICLLSNFLYAGTNPVTITAQTSLPLNSFLGSAYPIKYQFINTLPITVTPFSITPTASGGTYTLANTTCTNVLVPYASCTWTGTFTATTAGDNTATTTLRAFSSLVIPIKQATTTTTTSESASFIAVGYEISENYAAPLIYLSQDGANWTSGTFPATSILMAIAQYNGTWIAIGALSNDNASRIYASTNGITWSLLTSIPDAKLTSLAYGNGKWVAVGTSLTTRATLIYTSTDGSSWTKATLPLTGDVAFGSIWIAPPVVAYGNGRWVSLSVGASGGTTQEPTIYTSRDGTTWTAVAFPSTDDDIVLKTIAYGNGKWVAVGENRTTDTMLIYTSTDGITWMAVTELPSEDDIQLYLAAYGNGVWVIGGINKSGTIAMPVMYVSTTGENWSEIPSPVSGSGALSSILYAHDKWFVTYVVISDQVEESAEPKISTSVDLITWNAATLDKKPTSIQAIFVGVAAN